MNCFRQSDKRAKNIDGENIFMYIGWQIKTRGRAGTRQYIEALLHGRLRQLQSANRSFKIGDTGLLWHLVLGAHLVSREGDELKAG